MDIRGILNRKKSNLWKDEVKKHIVRDDDLNKDIEASYYYPIYTNHYDGEKNVGELGAPVNVVPDFKSLSARSREQYLKSDIAKIIINTYVDWVVGIGLKLQAEPYESIITKEGFNFNVDQFTEETESRFKLYSNSTDVDFKKSTSLMKIEREAKKAAIVDGDVLIVFRTTKNGPNIQLISGQHIATPIGGKYSSEAKNRGNKIIHGVEINNSGQHIAYYVANEDFTFTRIKARGSKTKRLQAFLLYGDEFRIDDVRGLPIYSTNLEKMKKIDRYVEATVGSAEERAKIPWFFEHGINSSNENPLTNTLKLAANAGEANEAVTQTPSIEDTAKKVAQTTGKNTINLPNDVTMKSIDSRNELSFGDFVNNNFIFISASVGIPYEVALSKFENSFSASRMAAKQWEHILKVRRREFTEAFLKPFYNLFLELQILQGKITADGYFTALQRKDSILLEAYRNCRFIGANVPHVDPLKEANAEVVKINNSLTTREAASEELGTGEFYVNVEKLKKEQELLPDNQIQGGD
jgi:lambda family phage portal protein